jgi:hypothetical protein
VSYGPWHYVDMSTFEDFVNDWSPALVLMGRRWRYVDYTIYAKEVVRVYLRGIPYVRTRYFLRFETYFESEDHFRGQWEFYWLQWWEPNFLHSGPGPRHSFVMTGFGAVITVLRMQARIAGRLRVRAWERSSPRVTSRT